MNFKKKKKKVIIFTIHINITININFYLEQIELLNELDNLVKSNETSTFNKNISSTSTNKPSSLLNRMKKNKEAGPSKLMELIKGNSLDERATKKVKFYNETELNKQPTKEIPEQNGDNKEQTTPAKTFLPEMNDIRKRQLFQRMASARQSLNIMTLEKEVDNKTSEFIIEKAKIIETKIHTDDVPSQSEHNKDTSSMETNNEGNLQNKSENDKQNKSNENKTDIVKIIMNKPKKIIKRKGTHKVFIVSPDEE